MPYTQQRPQTSRATSYGFTMSRHLGQQAFKALPRSVRVPVSRHIHSLQVPYSGHLSYNTIHRRLSPGVNLRTYFTEKRQQEARERREFIDIHDIGGVDPEDFDVNH